MDPSVTQRPVGQLCECRMKLATDCTEKWGLECDMGNNPEHARVHIQTPEEKEALDRIVNQTNLD